MPFETQRDVFKFRGHLAFPATASGAGSPFVIADTSAAGAPTFGGKSGGGYQMKFASTSEVENLCLYFGDVLAYDIDDLIRMEIIVKQGQATLNAATQLAFGMTSARNAAIDSIAAAALFRLVGDNNIVVESDDGTTDRDDVSTGLVLSNEYRRYAIDFATGIQSKEPPATSVGGKGNVQFFGGNANGSLRRVASGTLFDMSAYSDGLQPFVQLQKTADVNVNGIEILQVSVEYKQVA